MSSDRYKSESSLVSIHIVGDAYADLSCLLANGPPVPGGDSRLRVPIEIMAGGSAINTTTHLSSLVRTLVHNERPSTSYSLSHQLVTEVRLHTCINPHDEYGVLLMNHATKYGFPLTNCRRDGSKSATGHCVVIVSNDERSFMSHPGCNQDFEASDVNVGTLVQVPSVVPTHHLHVHVAGFYNMCGFWHGKLKAMLERVREGHSNSSNSTTTTTTISLVPQHDASEEWAGGILSVLPLVDFLILNEMEANGIARRRETRRDDDSDDDDDANIQEWARFFGEKSPSTYIIVTRGALGAVSLRFGEMIAMQSAATVDKVVDPTGAGDSFCAGFLYGLWNWQKTTKYNINGGWSVDAIRNAMLWGCSVASCNVLTRGASVPSKSERILEFLVKTSKLKPQT